MDIAIAILEKHLKIYWTEGPLPKDNYRLSDGLYFPGLGVYQSIELLKQEKKKKESIKAEFLRVVAIDASIYDTSIEP